MNQNTLLLKKEQSFKSYNKNRLLLLAASSVSTLGDAFFDVAVTLYVFKLTGSALSAGIMLIIAILPNCLFGQFIGVFTDRIRNKKRVLVVLNGLYAFTAAAVLFSENMTYIYSLFLLNSLIGLIFIPSMYSLVQRLIPSESYVSFESILRIVREVSMVLGPLLAGLLIHSAGYELCFLIQSFSFLAAGLFYLFLKQEQVYESGETPVFSAASVLKEWKEGWIYLWGQRKIKLLFITGLILNLCSSYLFNTEVYFLRELNGFSEVEFSLFKSVINCTVIGGIALFAFISKKGERDWVAVHVLSVLFIGIVILLLAFSYEKRVIIPLFALKGIFDAVRGTTYSSCLQLCVDRNYMGRVVSAVSSVLALPALISIGLGGFLADNWDLRYLMAISSLVLILLCPVLYYCFIFGGKGNVE